MTEPIRVLVADDEVLLRGTLRLLIDATAGMAVVGEAASGREAVELTAKHEPDVVLMDVRMPEMDGITATELISASRSASKVLVLTTFDHDQFVYGALHAGASGFLVKDTHRPGCSTRSQWYPRARRYSRRASPAGSSRSSPARPGDDEHRPGSTESPAASRKSSH